MDNIYASQRYFSVKHIINNPLHWCLVLVASILLLRLASLGLYPLFDTTEARYGEIARIMFETQNWVTPQFDYNEPFWGKPPMHTWLTAMSFSWFGVSEFSARLPHFACGLVTLLMVYHFASSFITPERVSASRTALLAVVILSSSLGFIVASGMVMTDSALLCVTTLAMISYWYCYTAANKLWGLVFFGALGLGMLVKGPVAIVITGIALVTWSISQGQFKKAIRCLPWRQGMGVFLAVCLPWYIWAEVRTPGFVEYFILGEHFQRFLVPGWSGDLYGSAHDQPKGMIWVFWLGAAFPWSFILIALAGKRLIKRIFSLNSTKKAAHTHTDSQSYQTASPPINSLQKNAQPTNVAGINAYLIAWMLAPMLLFTLAGNILSAYVLPGFSAMALLLARQRNISLATNLFASLTLLVMLVVLTSYSLGLTTKSTAADLLGKDRSFQQETALFYWQKRPFSARFYSKGQAQLITQHAELSNLLAMRSTFLLVFQHHALTKLEQEFKLSKNCIELKQTSERLMLQCF
ncbi:ArnT family glycosyltransferase [Thalassotalea euphylliae]|nr:glycosyltransferase family 39 protein [Thalassotalea euphylliae]